MISDLERTCYIELADVYSRPDRKALGIMEESATTRNGHYEIALPWRNYPPDLHNNKAQAERHRQLLKKRLIKQSGLLEKYRAFMDNLFLKDYASKIPQERHETLGTHGYLPHHPVFHPQKPDKVRVLFDCSAKHGNSSLNDQLLQGPDLRNSLVGVLTRFREEQIAFMSDIEAMFHQVRVLPSDRDALRFLWCVALGVRWNVSSDTFVLSIVIKDRPATRRGILSTVSFAYDPLGFVFPFILCVCKVNTTRTLSPQA